MTPTLGLFIQYIHDDPLFFVSVVLTVVLSIVLHELAHGWAAIRLGDRTPIQSGHMTADPLVHMGLWSALALAIAGIAWGQMPIDPTRMRGRYAEAIVAAAGPATNLALSVLALTALGIWLAVAGVDLAQVIRGEELSPALANGMFFLLIFGTMNLVLCLFNLLPAPPLDGSHILANFWRRYAQFVSDPANQGPIILMFVGAFIFGRVLFQLSFEFGERYVRFVSALLG